jgi:hypothetical protein
MLAAPSDDAGRTPGMAPTPDVGAPGGLETSLLAPGEGTGREGCGVVGVAEEAGGGRLSPTAKLLIERAAKRAAWDGNTRGESCPYGYDTPSGEHWTAVYVLAGGLIR